MRELYIDSVAHSYRGDKVLSSVYLSCAIGEVVGLLGRNGSGKSTLLKIIFGNLRPDYMYMRLNGQPIKQAYLSGQVSYLPQHLFIPQHLKIKDLVDQYTNTYRHQLLGEELITKHLDMPIGDLSGGQKRLVECLLVLYGDSDFVLLDEPFSQLSPIIIEEIVRHIQALSKFKGIVLTDHYYQHILNTSSRIVLLHNGCNYSIKNKEDLQLHGYISHER